MVFSDAIFVFLFLPAVMLFYYVTSSIKIRNIFLLVASLIFYSWGEPRYVFLMILSIIANHFFARSISNSPKSAKNKKIIAFACLFNLGFLFVFKYLAWILGIIGIKFSIHNFWGGVTF